MKESEGTASTTPRTYEEAIACPEAQFWIRAIDEELNNLLDHQTWQETNQLPRDKKSIGCRWLFKIKPIKRSQIPARA